MTNLFYLPPTPFSLSTSLWIRPILSAPKSRGKEKDAQGQKFLSFSRESSADRKIVNRMMREIGKMGASVQVALPRAPTALRSCRKCLALWAATRQTEWFRRRWTLHCESKIWRSSS